ncbi:MAG: hypothetical protein JNG90_05215 [Planctomycetaceae bacterium]|nr:hypothetical protein [Planctomycetaceae bacterium]
MRVLLRIAVAAVPLIVLPCGVAAAAELDLDAWSDPTSAYYEYFSDGFAQMNLRDPAPNEFRQRFHAISNPAVTYGGLDLFPHDEAFRFGGLEYDTAGLLDGYGTVPITGLNLGITADPSDPSYLNWQRFAATTSVLDIDDTSTVTVYNHVPVAVNLTASVRLVLPSVLGSTVPGLYDGTFTIVDNRFEVDIAGAPVLDTLFGTSPVSLAWQFTGKMTELPTLGDATGDDITDGADYTVWADNFLTTTASGAAGGDFNLDGLVDGADYTVWADHFSPAEPSFAAVPEPTSWSLALCGALGGSVLAVQRRLRATARKVAER